SGVGGTPKRSTRPGRRYKLVGIRCSRGRDGMSESEHAAFHKAIVANPADLTSRLVYADFLEETGEPSDVARGEVIRSPIEADGLPPNDPRRKELLEKADALFAAHWIEWWTPVCQVIGLPAPAPGDSGATGFSYRASQGCWVHRSRRAATGGLGPPVAA